MSPAVSDRVFSVRHQAWARLAALLLGDAVTVRRIRGGASEAWFVELDSGAAFSTRGIAAEGFLTVLSGRLRCTVFGNEVDLPAGHFTLLPPNTPFSIKVGGRASAQAIAHFSRHLPDALPIELP